MHVSKDICKIVCTWRHFCTPRFTYSTRLDACYFVIKLRKDIFFKWKKLTRKYVCVRTYFDSPQMFPRGQFWPIICPPPLPHGTESIGKSKPVSQIIFLRVRDLGRNQSSKKKCYLGVWKSHAWKFTVLKIPNPVQNLILVKLLNGLSQRMCVSQLQK